MIVTDNWTPDDLDLSAADSWWASADGPSFTNQGTIPAFNGDPVAMLHNRGGDGVHAIQGAGLFSGSADNLRPTLQYNILGDMPGIQFNGSTYLNLQKALGNGKSKYTYAFVFSATGSSGQRWPFGVTGSGRDFRSPRFETSAAAQHGVSNGGITDTLTGIVGWPELPSRTVCAGVVTAELDVGVSMYLNGVLAGTASWASTALATQQTFLLGLVNNTTAASTINPLGSNQFVGHFHEGFFASDYAATAAEVTRIFRYLKRWGGLWPTARNADVEPPSGHIQGVCFDGTHYYVSHTARLEKYDSSWSLVASNTSPFTSVTGSPNHVGDIDIYDGVIYAPVASDGSGSGRTPRIVRYSAADLSFIGETDISANNGGRSLSAVIVCPEINAIFVPDYYLGGKLLFRFKLSDRTFVGTVELQSAVANPQGMAWLYPHIYIASGADAGLHRCWPDGSQVTRVSDLYTTNQGIEIDKSTKELLQCREESGERVWRFANV